MTSFFKKARIITLTGGFLIGVALIIGGIFLSLKLFPGEDPYYPSGAPEGTRISLEILKDILPENEFSRPTTPLEEIHGIVVHYVGNPGTTAKQNRDYFAGLADSGATYASSHFVIGMDGEIIQCVPLDEYAYCSNERNADTISIECCHPEEDGVFTQDTYSSLVELCAELCRIYSLTENDVIRHYDVTGKICPRAFVDDEGAWIRFREDVGRQLSGPK